MHVCMVVVLFLYVHSSPSDSVGLVVTPPPAYPQPPPHSSIVLLQSCSNNPTGVDPSPEQWTVLFDIIKERRLLPFLDCAYQGFARYPFAPWAGCGMPHAAGALFAP
jgi:hypothetical protein